MNILLESRVVGATWSSSNRHYKIVAQDTDRVVLLIEK